MIRRANSRGGGTTGTTGTTPTITGPKYVGHHASNNSNNNNNNRNPIMIDPFEGYAAGDNITNNYSNNQSQIQNSSVDIFAVADDNETFPSSDFLDDANFRRSRGGSSMASRGGEVGGNNNNKDNQQQGLSIERTRRLREAYHIAKLRSSELAGGGNNLVIPLKMHGQMAGKLYSALSTLLYSSICASKASELERYIRKKAYSLPRSVFDLEAWESTLKIAKECREDGANSDGGGSLQAHLKQNMDMQVWIMTETISGAKRDMEDIKKTASKDLTDMQRALDYFKDGLLKAVKANDRSNTDEIFKLQSILAQQNELASLSKDPSQAATLVVQQRATIDLLEKKVAGLESKLRDSEGKSQESVKRSTERAALELSQVQAALNTMTEAHNVSEMSHNATIKKLQADLDSMNATNKSSLSTIAGLESQIQVQMRQLAANLNPNPNPNPMKVSGSQTKEDSAESAETALLLQQVSALNSKLADADMRCSRQADEIRALVANANADVVSISKRDDSALALTNLCSNLEKEIETYKNRLVVKDGQLKDLVADNTSLTNRLRDMESAQLSSSVKQSSKDISSLQNHTIESTVTPSLASVYISTAVDKVSSRPSTPSFGLLPSVADMQHTKASNGNGDVSSSSSSSKSQLDKISALESNVASLKLEVEVLQGKLRIASSATEIIDLQTKLKSAIEQNDASQQKVVVLESEACAYKAEAIELQGKLKSASAAESIVSSLKTEVAKLSSHSQFQQSMMANLEEDVKSKVVRIASLEDDLVYKTALVSRLESEAKVNSYYIEEKENDHKLQLVMKDRALSELIKKLNLSGDSGAAINIESTVTPSLASVYISTAVDKVSSRPSTPSFGLLPSVAEVQHTKASNGNGNGDNSSSSSSNSSKSQLDKISALESSVASLKLEVEVLQGKLKIASSATESQVSPLRTQVAHLNAQVQFQQSMVSNLQDEVKSKTEKISSLEDEIQTKRGSALSLAHLEGELKAKASRLAAFEEEVKLHLETIDNLESDAKRKSSRIDLLEGDMKTKNARISALEEDIKFKASLISSLDKETNQSKSSQEADMSNLKRQVDELKASLLAKESLLVTAQTEVSALKSAINQTQSLTSSSSSPSTSIITSTTVGPKATQIVSPRSPRLGAVQDDLDIDSSRRLTTTGISSSGISSNLTGKFPSRLADKGGTGAGTGTGTGTGAAVGAVDGDPNTSVELRRTIEELQLKVSLSRQQEQDLRNLISSVLKDLNGDDDGSGNGGSNHNSNHNSNRNGDGNGNGSVGENKEGNSESFLIQLANARKKLDSTTDTTKTLAALLLTIMQTLSSNSDNSNGNSNGSDKGGNSSNNFKTASKNVTFAGDRSSAPSSSDKSATTIALETYVTSVKGNQVSPFVKSKTLELKKGGGGGGGGVKYQQQQKQLIKLQCRIRGHLSRKRVERIRFEQTASRQGILVACAGTIQGETGWYVAQELMFYFCKESNGEFTLVCGPISKDMFNLAISELRMLMGEYFPANQKFPKTAQIDRLGIHSTRIQIETLMDEIKEKDVHISELYGVIKQLKVNVNLGIEDINFKYSEEIAVLRDETRSYQAAIQHLEQDKLKLESTIDLMSTKIMHSNAKSGLLERTSQLIQQMSPLEVVQLVKFQAAVRGYIGRCRVHRTRNVLSAKQSGVLIAMKNTVQGESGWYLSPNGSVFYFILDNGEWIMTAGPIDMTTYDAVVLDTKRKNRCSKPGMLVRCPFALTIEHEDIRGEVFMANRSEKIFVAVPVDYLVRAGGNQMGSLQERSISSHFSGSIQSTD